MIGLSEDDRQCHYSPEHLWNTCDCIHLCRNYESILYRLYVRARKFVFVVCLMFCWGWLH